MSDVFDIAQGLVAAAERLAVETWAQHLIDAHKGSDGRMGEALRLSFSPAGAVVDVVDGPVYVFDYNQLTALRSQGVPR